ncbi:MAG: Gfo/Idh/MocA family oxidoreductase [Cellvibrio sp.]
MLNVALCAYGMSGKIFQAPLIVAHPKLHLHSILQRSGDSALQDYPAVNIVKTLDEILQNPEIDIVVVNTPNEFHYEMARRALKAGKHVVVEKPICLTEYEAERLVELARRENKMLAVFQNKRLEPDHLTVQKIVDSKQLGRIVEVEWHYDRYRKEITHKKWKEDPQAGAGTWFDLGIHMIDSMLCIFGAPRAVFGDMRSLRREEGSVDYFNVICYYPDMRVILRSSTYVSEKGPSVIIHGDKGSFQKFGQDVQEAQLAKGILPGMEGYAKLGEDNYGLLTLQPENGTSVKREKIASEVGCYEAFYDNVVNHILRGEPLKFDASLPILGMKVLRAAEDSFIQGRIIPLQ